MVAVHIGQNIEYHAPRDRSLNVLSLPIGRALKSRVLHDGFHISETTNVREHAKTGVLLFQSLLHTSGMSVDPHNIKYRADYSVP